MSEMGVLVVPRRVHAEIGAIIDAGPKGCETGIYLFGVHLEGKDVVLAVAGPGPLATHRRLHYSGDAEFVSWVYRTLRMALPSVEWLGEMHLHPLGMPHLSNGDLHSVRQGFAGDAPDALQPETMIAGVLQRSPGTLSLHPVKFGKVDREGTPLLVEVVPTEAEIVSQARSAAARSRSAMEPVAPSVPMLSAPKRKWHIALAWMKNLVRRKRP